MVCKRCGRGSIAKMSSSFPHLPKALPWIELSINCLHQESISSLMVGNVECAIISMCSLMEHVLRMAIVKPNECGLHRPESMSQIDKYNSLLAIIEASSGHDVF